MQRRADRGPLGGEALAWRLGRGLLRPGLLRRCLLSGGLVSGCLVSGLLLGGCGPSFEVLAEGDLRFKHCDRLDLDANISPSHRLHCWREWRRMYTYGQTRDRVEYAQRRIAEVVSGDTDPPFQLPTGTSLVPRHPLSTDQGLGVAPEAASPAPGSSAASSSAAAASPDPSLAVGAPSSEMAACQSRCELASASCLPGCETKPTGCKPCETPFEACLRDCQPEAH